MRTTKRVPRPAVVSIRTGAAAGSAVLAPSSARSPALGLHLGRGLSPAALIRGPSPRSQPASPPIGVGDRAAELGPRAERVREPGLQPLRRAVEARVGGGARAPTPRALALERAREHGAQPLRLARDGVRLRASSLARAAMARSRASFAPSSTKRTRSLRSERSDATGT